MWHAFDPKLGLNIIILTPRLLEGTVILFALCLLLLPPPSSSWLHSSWLHSSLSTSSVIAVTHLHISRARKTKTTERDDGRLKIDTHMRECTQTHQKYMNEYTYTEGQHYHGTPGTRVSAWLTLWWMTAGRIVGTRESVWCDWWNWSRALLQKEKRHQCAYFHLHACILCHLGYFFDHSSR